MTGTSINPIYNITQRTVEVYSLRQANTSDYWADIVIDAKGSAGRVYVASDFGSWNYYWTGWEGTPFKQFLLKIDMDYTAEKFRVGDWFSIEETIIRISEELSSDTAITDANREKCSNELVKLRSCHDIESFYKRASETIFLWTYYGGALPYVKTVHPRFKKFWNGPWKQLMEKFKEEIQVQQPA